MKTLDTDTLAVIESPAQPMIENEQVADTTEASHDSSIQDTATSTQATIETLLPENHGINSQATTETQPDQSTTTATQVDAVSNLNSQSPHNQEVIAVLSNAQESPTDTINTSQPLEKVLATDSADTQTYAQDTDTSTIQTFNDVTVTEPSLLLFGVEWLMLAVVLVTSIALLIAQRKTARSVEQLSETKTVHQHISDVDIEFEKAKIIADSRQQWIHALREEIANFVSATNAIWDLHKIKDGCEDILTEMKDPQFVMKELYNWSCTYNQAMQETEKLYAKIHLLINPQEETSQHLSSLLDKAMLAVEAKKSPSKLNDEIVAASQRILKDEWLRVKEFK